MFKSIFQRLLFTYAAIIIAVIIILAVLLTCFINYYLYEQKQNQLLSAGYRARELAGGYRRSEIDHVDQTFGDRTVFVDLLYQRAAGVNGNLYLPVGSGLYLIDPGLDGAFNLEAAVGKAGGQFQFINFTGGLDRR